VSSYVFESAAVSPDMRRSKRMRNISLKIEEELLGEVEELTRILNVETGLKISRHSVMLKAIATGVRETLGRLRDSNEGGMLES
tara:strand:+ start:151 stop:402 length:252 start_codon:yes stop_codon:yes gene_type:complete